MSTTNNLIIHRFPSTNDQTTSFHTIEPHINNKSLHHSPLHIPNSHTPATTINTKLRKKKHISNSPPATAWVGTSPRTAAPPPPPPRSPHRRAPTGHWRGTTGGAGRRSGGRILRPELRRSAGHRSRRRRRGGGGGDGGGGGRGWFGARTSERVEWASGGYRGDQRPLYREIFLCEPPYCVRQTKTTKKMAILIAIIAMAFTWAR